MPVERGPNVEVVDFDVKNAGACNEACRRKEGNVVVDFKLQSVPNLEDNTGNDCENSKAKERC